MAERTAERLGCRPDQVLVLSTGVIGRRLDMNAVARGIDRRRRGAVAQCGARRRARDHDHRHATQDSPRAACPRAAASIAIAGFAKGAGMIHSRSMATMLGVVLTDAVASPERLQRRAGRGGAARASTA